jgi:16S rRNA A1518/A1519 N6-dimethyltransferase RsmA/KsgA/DIM1 with predicted DNA glycosylase/AP lyase activity
MPVLFDPEGTELKTLFKLYHDWKMKSVLEIGSGDGRLTWIYADKAARVVAIEPDTEKYNIALAERPGKTEHVTFFNLSLDEFYSAQQQDLSDAWKRLKKWLFETLHSLLSRTPSRYPQWLTVTKNKEKFDLAILSWSL